MKTIIFTDLDGTLLDSRTYSFEAARPALGLIRAKSVALVLCSSKTRAEQETIRERLGNIDPFIVESGGGIFVPKGYFSFSTGGEESGEYFMTRLGMPYRTIRKEFVELREKLKSAAIGFGDMTSERIAGITGLSLDEAALAAQREFDEPFVFDKGVEQEFLKALEERGLSWSRDKFYHVMGPHDKGKAVSLLIKWYERAHGKIITIGLGDALNDLPLLQQVDCPVLVQRENGTFAAAMDIPRLVRANGRGPAGWNNAVLRVIEG